MAEELISLQSELLALQDQEQALDADMQNASEALAKEGAELEGDASRTQAKEESLKYLHMLASVVRSRRIASSVVPVVGELRVRLTRKEAVVLEVGPTTEFGDIVEMVLDYIEYPKVPTVEPAASDSSFSGRKRAGSDPSFKGFRGIRPRSSFCLCDIHGAIFGNEMLVVDAFASSSVLWMARLIIKPNTGQVFDAEEEIASYFSAPENAKWLMQLSAAKSESKLITPIESEGSGVGNGVLGSLKLFEGSKTRETAHGLLVGEYEQRSQSLSTADLTVIGKHSKLKKKQAIALANERRNQSRRQGLFLECIVHLVFVLFAFFAAFVYTDYARRDPENVAIVNFRDLVWDEAEFGADFPAYFAKVIAPWKKSRLNSTWLPGEVRIRQLRVNCGASNQCPKYSALTTSRSSPFNANAQLASRNPEIFNFQVRSSLTPITELSFTWDSRNLVTDYDSDGGYLISWPPTEGDALPDFSGWIDEGTAVIIAEFNFYEPQTNVIVAAKVVAQYPNYRSGSVSAATVLNDCGPTSNFFNPFVPVVLLKVTPNLDTLVSNSTTMTILSAVAMFCGILSILRGVGFFKLAISGDRDIARAVEVYKPNAGLLRSAMLALRVAKSKRLFNPSFASVLFWVVLDLVVICLNAAAIIYQYTVVQKEYSKLFAYVDSQTSGYSELYGLMQDINVVNSLLSFASWIAIFTGIRLLVLLPPGVLIADTVTQSILPGLLVLLICGYAPLGVALASVSNSLFGYADPAFETLFTSTFSVVSLYISFDDKIAASWRPLVTIITLLYITVTSAIAYAIVFYAYQREVSKLVKGPFTVWEIIWPFPAIRAWLREGFKNDLWASALSKHPVGSNESDISTSNQQPPTVETKNKTKRVEQMIDSSDTKPNAQNEVTSLPESAQATRSAPRLDRTPTNKSEETIATLFEDPLESVDVSVRRNSVVSVDHNLEDFK